MTWWSVLFSLRTWCQLDRIDEPPQASRFARWHTNNIITMLRALQIKKRWICFFTFSLALLPSRTRRNANFFPFVCEPEHQARVQLQWVEFANHSVRWWGFWADEHVRRKRNNFNATLNPLCLVREHRMSDLNLFTDCLLRDRQPNNRSDSDFNWIFNLRFSFLLKLRSLLIRTKWMRSDPFFPAFDRDLNITFINLSNESAKCLHEESFKTKNL